MSEGAKAVIVKRLTDQGFTSSYAVLLYTTALLGSNPDALEPSSDEERHDWHGYCKGLRSALVCLAMHEMEIEAELAAAIVGVHVAQAISDLEQAGGSR